MVLDAEHGDLVSRGTEGRFSLKRLRRIFTGLEVIGDRSERLVREQDALSAQLAATATALHDQMATLREDVLILSRTQNAILRNLTLPEPAIWDDVLADRATSHPGTDQVFSHSTLCRQESLEHPAFLYWMTRLHERATYHRKQWEFVFICQALFERGQFQSGHRGLGFGVGSEPLSALFASEGCVVTGTDQAFESAVDKGWAATDQHAAGKEALRFPAICDDADFDARVSFEPADMNDIPVTLRGFDFCWSACAYEHLGSIENGLAFVQRSLDTLKPGGWAVHTTELNLTSDSQTIEKGPTVLFRQSDFERLAQRLTAKGHRVAPFDWSRGQAPLDRYIDLPPYLKEPHLRLLFDGYETTSFGIIVQKAP